MLIELPNGDWVDPGAVQGVRMMNDKQFGPRVVIDASGTQALYFFHMDDAEAARAWVKDFCSKCNDLLQSAQVS